MQRVGWATLTTHQWVDSGERRRRKGESFSINRILEQLGGIRETLIVYPRRQGQRKTPTATCLTRMNEIQLRLFSLLDLQRFSPATH